MLDSIHVYVTVIGVFKLPLIEDTHVIPSIITAFAGNLAYLTMEGRLEMMLLCQNYYVDIYMPTYIQTCLSPYSTEKLHVYRGNSNFQP